MTQVVSRSLANAVYLTKHDGNGDNRFAILIEGTGTGAANSFEKDQYKYNIQEMGLLLTEHPGNIKPGPGYTGYYLQDHIYYIGDHNVFPYLDRDAPISKDFVIAAIEEISRASDSYDKVIFYYTSFGGLSGTISYFDADNTNSIDINKDVKADKIDDYLDMIESEDMVIILQPDYSGDWITDLKQDGTKPERNRVILTSEQSGQALDSKFDKCNIVITDTSDHKVYYTTFPFDLYYPFGDEENYDMGGGNWIYVVSDSEGGSNDGIYEIDEDDLGIDFYENPFDFGSEFVSGLTEGYYIDRDYYGHSSNDDLDADIDINNDYISCKEAYNFMKLWHLGYKLGPGITHGTVTNPWYDDPKIEYTWLEEGTVHLY